MDKTSTRFKITALITLGAFVFSGILCQPLYAAVELFKDNAAEQSARTAAARIGADKAPSIPEGLMIPCSNGRITDAELFDSAQTVINIQDLHCHPEVQRNISQILSSLDKKYGLKNVYVEGGYGDISTSWICDVKDKEAKSEILETLVGQGRLTGAEYYSALSNRPYLLKGLEEEKAHKANIVRLGEIIDKEPYFRQKVKALNEDLEFLKTRHFSSRNRRFDGLIEKYKAGRIDTDKYYALLSKYAGKINKDPEKYNALLTVSMENYPGISAYLELSRESKQLRYKKISGQLQEFMKELKSKIPYRVYNALAAKTDNFSKTDELYIELARIAKEYKLNLAGNFSDLNMFFKYAEKSQKINPVSLIQEEKRLTEEIRIGFSRNKSELEVSFLADYFHYFSDYLLNTISADDYKYFSQRFGEFKSVWNKYSPAGGIRGLEQDMVLLNEFYETNFRRNDYFLKNIPLSPGSAANRKGTAPEIIVVVSGGFHAEGLKKLLHDRKISYLCVTPNVTRDTAVSSATYAELAKRQAKMFGQQALALTLGSTKAEVIYFDQNKMVVKLEGEEILFTKHDGKYVLDARALKERPLEMKEVYRLEYAVQEAFSIASKAQFLNPLLSSELIYQLITVLGRYSSRENIFGGNGLIWSIVSDPEVQNAINKEGITANELRGAAEYLQEIWEARGLKRRWLILRSKNDPLISAMIQVPGMQAYINKPAKSKKEVLLDPDERILYQQFDSQFETNIRNNKDMQNFDYPLRDCSIEANQLAVKIEVVKGHTIQCEDGRDGFFRIEKVGSMSEPKLHFVVTQGFVDLLMQQGEEDYRKKLISQAVCYGFKRHLAYGIFPEAGVKRDFNTWGEFKELAGFIANNINEPAGTKKSIIIPAGKVKIGSGGIIRLIKLFIESMRQASEESRNVPTIVNGKRAALINEVEIVTRQYARYSIDCVNKDTNYLPPDSISLNIPNVNIPDKRTSPTNIGLYLQSILLLWKSGMLDKEDALERIGNTIKQVEALEKYEEKDADGKVVVEQLYNWYLIDGDCKPQGQFVSTVDNGNFVASLIILESALEIEKGKDPSSVEYDEILRLIDGMINKMDMEVFFNRDSGLLCPGIDKREDGGYEQRPGAYNTLGSEARTCYLVLAMQHPKNEIYKGAWKNLYRQLPANGDGSIRVNPNIPISSWTGTMFEHFLAEIFSRVKGSPIDEANKIVILEQMRENCGGILTTLFGKKIGRRLQSWSRTLELLELKTGSVWGTSEAGTVLVKEGGYYFAAGNSSVAQNDRFTEETLECSILVPYACLLPLTAYDIESQWSMRVMETAMQNLRNLDGLNMGHPIHGYYESYTITRTWRGYKFVPIKRIYGHHQNMALLPLLNLRQKIEKKDGTPEEDGTSALFLKSRRNNGVVEKLVNTEIDEYKDSDDPLPKTPAKPANGSAKSKFDLARELMGNGGYCVYLPGKEDSGPTVACKSPSVGVSDNRIIYIKDEETGKVLSVGLDKALSMEIVDGKGIYKYHLDLGKDRLGYDSALAVTVTMAVGSEDDVEKWDIDIEIIGSSLPREIFVTPYVEWTVGDMNAREASRTYHDMHIETQIDPWTGVITAHGPDKITVGWLCFGGKAKLEDWRIISLIQWLFRLCFDNRVKVEDWGTSRLDIIGRLRDSYNPIFLENGNLGKNSGFPLVPAGALTTKVIAMPGKVSRVTVLTGAAGTTKAAIKTAKKYRIKPLVASTGPAIADSYLPTGGIDSLINKMVKLSKSVIRSAETRGFKEKELTEFDVFKNSLHKMDPVHALLICSMLGIAQPELEGMDDSAISEKLSAVNEKQAKKDVEQTIKKSGFAIVEKVLGTEWNTLTNEGIISKLGQAAFYFNDTDEYVKAVLRKDAGELFDLLRKGRNLSAKDLQKINMEFLNAMFPYNPAAPVYRFSENGKVCRVFRPKATKKPWSYPDSNGLFGFVATVSGSFFAFGKNSQKLRTTLYNPNIVTEGVMSGIMMEFKDTKSGRVLFGSLTPNPQAFENCTYQIEETPGYIRYFLRHNDGDFTVTTTRFVAKEGVPVGFAEVEVECKEGCEYQLMTYNKFDTNGDSQKPDFKVKNGMLVMTNGQHAFHTIVSNTGATISGNTGTAIESDTKATISGDTGKNEEDDSDFIGLKTSPIRHQKRATFYVMHGQTDTNESVHELTGMYSTVEASKQAFTERMKELKQILGGLHFSIPFNRNIEAMLNYWLTYQIYIVHILARSALYQSGGAYGFRDQAQSMLGLLSIGTPEMNERGKNYLKTLCAHQFELGDVQSWWHEHINLGQRTIISDLPLWLLFYAIVYMDRTGDASVLNEEVSFIEQAPLAPGQRDRMEVAKDTKIKYTVYEHLKRAFMLVWGERLGEHGIPLHGGGDWNDALDQLGDHEKGESAFNAFLLLYILPRFAKIAFSQNDAAFAEKCLAAEKQLKKDIDTHLWNGKYFIRGFDKEGQPVEFCDVIVQSWAAMALGRNDPKARKAVKYAIKRLYKPKEKLILLFDKILTTEIYGKITKYPLGIRENLAQYTHGVTWTVTAFIEVLKGLKEDLDILEKELKTSLNKIRDEKSSTETLRYMWICGLLYVKTLQYKRFGDKLQGLLDCFSPMEHAKDERYGGEPYLVAADIYGGKYLDIIFRQLFGLVIRGKIGKAFALIAFIRKQGYDRRGECGWTGYTGSSSWIYRNAVEGVMGIKFKAGNIMNVDPCIPREWDGYTSVYERRNSKGEVIARYVIKVDNPYHVFHGVEKITVDGKEIDAIKGIELPNEGDPDAIKTINVEVVLGPRLFSLRAALRDLLKAVFAKAQASQHNSGGAKVDIHNVSLINLQQAIDTFGAASEDENGVLHTNVYLVDELPGNPEDRDLKKTKIMENLWSSTKEGALVLFADNVDIQAVAKTIKEGIRDEKGSARLESGLEDSFDEVNIKHDYTELEPGIIIDHNTIGKKIHYNENGSMVVPAEWFMDENGQIEKEAIAQGLGYLLTIRNAESVAMPQNFFINMDSLTNMEEFLKKIEAFNKAGTGNGQLIVDPAIFKNLELPKIEAIAELARRSGVRMYVDLTAKEQDSKLKEAKEYFEKCGFPGYAFVNDNRAVIHDFLSSGSGIEADVINFKNEEPSLERLKQKIKQSRTLGKAINLIDLNGLLKGGERSIIDRVALTELLKTSILSFYDATTLSNEDVTGVGQAWNNLPSLPDNAEALIKAVENGAVGDIVSEMGLKGVSHSVNKYLDKLSDDVKGTENEPKLQELQKAFLKAIVEQMLVKAELDNANKQNGLADRELEIILGQKRLQQIEKKTEDKGMLEGTIKEMEALQESGNAATFNHELNSKVKALCSLCKSNNNDPQTINTIIELIKQFGEPRILDQREKQEILFRISSFKEILAAA